MKNIVYIFLIVLITTSCELTQVLDVDPPNNLVPENVATDPESSENLLTGAYATMNNQYHYMFTETTPGLLSGTMSRKGFLADAQIAGNTVEPDDNSIDNYWSAFYSQIDAANTVIELIPEVPDAGFAPNRKKEMLGEAHFLRAMAHFDVLRYFGEFFDRSSEHGAIIRTEPVNFTTRAKDRSSVEATYTQVLNDLDFAIANAPDFTVTYYASKTAAKALKARVLLYMGEYTDAAALADEVITDGDRVLSGTFEDVFKTNTKSSEMIFMRYTDEVSASMDRKKFTYGSRHAVASDWLKALMTDDPRAEASFDASDRNKILKVNQSEHFSPTYYIRLAEMYLIKAEALARSGAALDQVKEPLEIVRSRAFGSPQNSSATTVQEALDEIYNEIIAELAFENGSDWFAGIRFDKIMTVKPSVTSVDQYILPIPQSEIDTNSALDSQDQNPGYDQ